MGTYKKKVVSFCNDKNICLITFPLQQFQGPFHLVVWTENGLQHYVQVQQYKTDVSTEREIWKRAMLRVEVPHLYIILLD